MFIDILKNLMEENNVENQRQLAIKANIPTTTINGWFNANRLPDYHAIIKLAKFFNVPSDRILGLEDENGNEVTISNSFNDNSQQVHIRSNSGNITIKK